MNKIALGPSIFIARENIIFLKEWVDYHYKLGVSEFHLYDNSAVQDPLQRSCTNKSHFKVGSVNKYNVDYAAATAHLSDSDIDRQLKAIQESYPTGVINYISWQPRTAEGTIHMYQSGAIAATLNSLYERRGSESQVDWMVNLDMDEYLTLAPDLDLVTFLSNLPADTNVVKLLQVKHLSRFSDLNTPVLQKPALWDSPQHTGQKWICSCLGGAWKPGVHRIRHSGELFDNKDLIWFRHYNGTI